MVHLVGILIVTWFFTRKHNESYLWLLARLSIPATLTASAIRIGNFMNSEIVGEPTTVPWAVIFQRLDNIPRHPSQLYEALAYLIILGLLWVAYSSVKKSFATKLLPAIFFISMFTVRFLLEFVKTKQATYTDGWTLTMGQYLSIPFIVLGLLWLIWAFTSKTATPHS